MSNLGDRGGSCQKPKVNNMFCSPRCKKWTALSVSAVFLVLGVILAIGWRAIVNKILDTQLSLSSHHSKGYEMWHKPPVTLYMQFYMFNWTNAKEYVADPSITPKFEEFGPYTFSETHIRRNVTINHNNDTVTFYTEKTWHFEKGMSNGSLDDMITTFNPIVAVIANIVKWKHYLVKEGVSFLLKEKKEKLYVSKTVGELLYDGYDDPMLDLLKKLNTTFTIPLKKFGWFAERNNSREYDGLFNINSGADDIQKLGILRNWNYRPNISYYHGDCASLNGTTGEIWYPVHDKKTIKVFTSDLCSTLELDYVEETELYGVRGHRYQLYKRNFDNGSTYPAVKCFVPDGVTEQLSGVRNVSACKFGAPAFISFAHFLDADPAFSNAVEGMAPNESIHRMYLSLEPDTGVPLNLGAILQLNLLMEPVEGIEVIKNVRRILMPAFWFKQSVELTENLAHTVKILLVLPDVGEYTGYGFLGFGILILAIGIVVTTRKGWSSETYKI